jgi:hypothetical protein
MKTYLLLSIACFIATILFAQTPQSFKYQAVARDNGGSLLMNQPVTFRISILQGSAGGASVYAETHPVTTNNFGLANLNIGGGTPVSGNFTTIVWGSNTYYIKVELDPLGGSAYQLMGTSQLLSVPYALYAKNSGDGVGTGTSGQTLHHNGTSWTGSSTLYNNGTNVGIGTYTPLAKLHVLEKLSSGNNIGDVLDISRGTTGTPANGIGSGLVFRNQVSNNGYAISGRIASVMENVDVSYGTSAGMLFQTRNANSTMNDAIYIDSQGKVGIGYNTPLGKLHVVGDLQINSSESSVALFTNALASGEAGLFQNYYAGNATGLKAGMNSTSAGSGSYGIYGYNYGFGIGVYGMTTKSTGIGTYGYNQISNNLGFLGGGSYAVYGEHGNGHHGYLGGNDVGAYGKNSVSGHYGSLGSSSNGVYGYLNYMTTTVGNYAIIGSGVNTSGPTGTGYAKGSTIGGVMGDNYWGNPYTFANAGYSYLDYNRSGGSFGSNYTGTSWGSLAYKNSTGNVYGGYFTTYTQGSGKDNLPKINNGIGVWGDLFGADIHGKVYGAYIEGENYATFANGDTYRTGLDIHLQENASTTNTVLYTAVATDATIQTSGYAIVSNGKATVSFDQNFTSAVSGDQPVIVTVTPMGNSNGIYLSEVNTGGFSVVENNSGKSHVTVSYIAIGKRKGHENPKLPQEVIAADYTSKLAQGLHNDNETGTDGAGLYYENEQLHVGKHPSTFPDLNKQPAIIEMIEKPERRVPENIGDGIVPDVGKFLERTLQH